MRRCRAARVPRASLKPRASGTASGLSRGRVRPWPRPPPGLRRLSDRGASCAASGWSPLLRRLPPGPIRPGCLRRGLQAEPPPAGVLPAPPPIAGAWGLNGSFLPPLPTRMARQSLQVVPSLALGKLQFSPRSRFNEIYSHIGLC